MSNLGSAETTLAASEAVEKAPSATVPPLALKDVTSRTVRIPTKSTMRV